MRKASDRELIPIFLSHVFDYKHSKQLMLQIMCFFYQTYINIAFRYQYIDPHDFILVAIDD